MYTDSYAPNAFFVLDTELPQEIVDLPIEQVAAWNWEEFDAEPPIAEDRSWLAV